MMNSSNMRREIGCVLHLSPPRLGFVTQLEVALLSGTAIIIVVVKRKKNAKNATRVMFFSITLRFQILMGIIVVHHAGRLELPGKNSMSMVMAW